MSRIKRFSPKIMHTIENFIENGVSKLRELTIKRGKVLCNKDFQVIEEIEEKFLIPFFDYGYSRFGKIEQFQISFIGFSQQQMDELIDLLARLTY